MSDNKIIVSVKDMGVAAYLFIHKYKLEGRRGREFDFIIDESEQEEFRKKQVEYVNSVFCEFDNALMSLKRL